MEKRKLDNGLLLIAHITNVAGPLIIMIYFAIGYFMDPVKNEGDLIILIPLAIMVLISVLMFVGFRKVKFDDEYIYVRNVFNKETDTFPIKNLRSVQRAKFSFGGRNNRSRSGKNYKMIYLSNDGIEKKLKFMATANDDDAAEFKRRTSFLGENGFNPE
ncbi:MAG: hypothetical protein K0Q95_732 [Bacteroidota bacterium]|jgi:hypothetical protein|nr:hypothetical protein [Bacteroidota bacterium]